MAILNPFLMQMPTNKPTPQAKPASNGLGSDGLAGIYWRNYADGNIYTQNNAGVVTKVGGGVGVLKSGNQTFNGQGYREVAAIGTPKTGGGGGANTVPTVNAGGGGGGGTTYSDTTAARNATQKNIDAVDQGYKNSLSGITSEYDRILAQYADEEALNAKTFNEQTTSNEQTRSSNIQGSLLAAAQGGKGLRSTLAALGVTGGTGLKLAGRAVASEANKDIGAGNKVFESNATQLNTANEKTKQDEKNRRSEASAAKTNQEAAAARNAAKEKQTLYEKMAGLFKDAGNTGEANRYTGMVGDLATQVVGGPTTAAAYSPRNIAFEAGKLGTYLAGANDMTVKADGIGAGSPPINSPLYALTTKKKEEVL